MFTTTTTTVAQAVAPFQKVKDKLLAVIAHQNKELVRSKDAIEAAYNAYKSIRDDESLNIGRAEMELEEAKSLLTKVEELIGSPAPESKSATTPSA